MAAAISYEVRAPQWVFTYQGVDISADVSPMVRAIRYVDRLDNESGELEVELEDHAKRWQRAWYPALGDQVGARIGYRGEGLLNCGDFQIDELELDGPPDVMRVRCLAASVTPAMRTPNSAAYENQSLVAIAASIAAKYGLELIAAPQVGEGGEGDIAFARVTQRSETDLEFLKRLANRYDFDFTVRGGQLVFYARTALEAAPAVRTIVRADTERVAFRNRTRRIYGGAQVSYFSPQSKRLISQTVTAPSPTGDTVKIVERVENSQQAVARADAALKLHNMVFVEAAIEGPGIPVAVSGNVFQLSGWGAFDGRYLIDTARHRIDRATGYTTAYSARRLG
ncbi:MAG TPA: contractile injection system protein, VgrG/Pvc8 family [Candidatus Acidoferrales bacterium]|nr:contractile injection system protein, VgrG/Pvc8 family [Candidatus Acidoferrales bacterium]